MAQVGEGWVIPPPALFGHICVKKYLHGKLKTVLLHFFNVFDDFLKCIKPKLAASLKLFKNYQIYQFVPNKSCSICHYPPYSDTRKSNLKTQSVSIVHILGEISRIFY